MAANDGPVPVRFDSLPRPIIDGRPAGFCKLIVDRELHVILGCHVVGERAVELAQLAATAMAAKMPVEQLALVPFSFPTYANALGRAAIVAAIELDHTGMWAVGINTVTLIIVPLLPADRLPPSAGGVRSAATVIVAPLLWLVGLGAIVLIFSKRAGPFYQQQAAL
jgi:hypothetical protein